MKFDLKLISRGRDTMKLRPEKIVPSSTLRRAIFSANTSWYIYNFRRNTIKSFLNRGYEVYTISPRDAYTEKLKALGCKTFESPLRAASKNPWHELRSLLHYYRTYRKVKPDIAFHFTIKCNFYGSVAARALRIPYVNNISGLGSAFNSEGIFNHIIRAIYKLTQSGAAHVFFQNASDHELLTSNNLVPKKRSSILPGSGVDLDSFVPDWVSAKKTFTFVFASRILWEKGFPYLPEAMRRVRSKADVECLVYGFVDPKNPKYVSLADLVAWESEGLLSYCGPLDDVREAYRRADCVVLPTYYREGVPRSLLEAAAMGKPIITTDWVGCREVVQDNLNGLLCEAKSTESLAQAMLKMASLEPSARKIMGEQGRRLMEERFSETFIIGEYLRMEKFVKG